MSAITDTVLALEHAVHEEREAALLRLVASLFRYNGLCTPDSTFTPLLSPAAPDMPSRSWSASEHDRLLGALGGEQASAAAATDAAFSQTASAHPSRALAAAMGDVREQIRDVELAFTPPGQLWAVPLSELMADPTLSVCTPFSASASDHDDNLGASSALGEEDEEDEEDDWPTDLADPDLSADELTEMLEDLPIIDAATDVPRCTPVWGGCSQQQWLLLGDGEALGSQVRQRADIEQYIDLGHAPFCLQGTREEATRWLLQAAAMVRAAPSHQQAPTNQESELDAHNNTAADLAT